MEQSSTGSAPPRHLVVFVCDRPHPRIAKLGFGLKSLGCQVVLLHRNALPTADSARCFDETRHYNDPSEALQLARQFQPMLYHVFSSWNFDTAEMFMRNRPGRIVFDDYDVISGVARPEFMAANYPGLQQSERYCLENADGITCRDLLLQTSKRELHYQIRGRVLYLPDCCWGDHADERSSGIDADALHLVYAGNMAIEKNAASPHPRDNFYFLDFARDITSSGIHFHVYPSPSFTDGFENTLSDHLELASRTPYYHVHRPLHADRLVAEISRYDLGLLSMWQETRDSNKAYLPVIFSHSTSNKLFDYLDAGLGIVTCDAMRFQRWFLGKNDVCISAYLEDAREAILSQPLSFWRGLRKRARLARDSFSARVHARRLLRFYLTLIGVGQDSMAQMPPAKGEQLILAHQAFQQGEIEEAISHARLELHHFPDQPDTKRFLTFLQAYQCKTERMVST